MKAPDNSAAATLVYEEVKRRIATLRYPPGTKLSEIQLVQELGYGRSPIRTAFSRLQNDGWLTVTPQSGTYVKRLSEDEIREIYDLRLLLETHATRAAALHMGDDELRRLRRAFRRLAPRAGDPIDDDAFDEINELDGLFHAAVYRAAGNGLVTSILLNLLEKVQWLKKATPSPPDRMRRWCAELGRVLDALERHDPELAAARMREHIGQAAESGSAYRRLSSAGTASARPQRAARGAPVATKRAAPGARRAVAAPTVARVRKRVA